MSIHPELCGVPRSGGQAPKNGERTEIRILTK
jgi:hypothetical protein